MALARACCTAALLLACTPRPTEHIHAPVAPTVVEAPPVVPDSAGAGPTHWSTGETGATCRADHVANLSFVPAAATLVAGVDATAIVGSGAWAELRELFERGDSKALVEIAQGCELGVSSWRGITFGGETAGTNSIMVLRADGIGRPDRLECLRAGVERKEGKSPWAVTPGTTPSELALEGGGVALALDPCTLLVASAGWAKAVRERVGGVGSSALEGSIGAAVARVDARKPAWMATAIPSAMTTGSPFDGAKDVAGTLDVAGGLAIAMSITFSDPAQATKRAGELQQQLDGMKGAMGGMGMPAGIVDSIRIVAAGAQVLVQVAASEADLRAFKKSVGPMISP